MNDDEVKLNRAEFGFLMVGLGATAMAAGILVFHILFSAGSDTAYRHAMNEQLIKGYHLKCENKNIERKPNNTQSPISKP